MYAVQFINLIELLNVFAFGVGSASVQMRLFNRSLFHVISRAVPCLVKLY